MKPLLALTLAATVLVALVLGCSKRELETAPRLHFEGIMAPDSAPGPHPTPPPHDTTFIPPVEFLGSDSTLAGTTGITRWRIGNNEVKTLTIPWTLSEFEGWPGFPIQGSIRVRGRSTELLEVPVPVPSTATTGSYTLLLRATTGNLTWGAYGSIGVHGNDPPPPPPPPVPAVQFAGSDSARAGETATTAWDLANESDHAFTMSWTLSGQSWPDLPKQGSEQLGPFEQRRITVQVAVPDTAATGFRTVEMVVKRPDSLPPASSQGWIWVVP